MNMEHSLEFAFNGVEHYYNRMMEVKTYKAKANNLNNILYLIDSYPELLEYWHIDLSAHFYQDRVFKIKNFNRTYQHRPFASYIINLEDLNTLKVGKTNNVERRFCELEEKYGSISTEHIFYFPIEYMAYRFESDLHLYFYKKYPNTYEALDRFKGVKITEEDLAILKERAKEIEEETMNWLKRVGL